MGEGKARICLHLLHNTAAVLENVRIHRRNGLAALNSIFTSVKAKLHINLHRKYLLFSWLWVEVKGEGKKHKLAEFAYTRVREGRNE